jgi:hypothetical protein
MSWAYIALFCKPLTIARWCRNVLQFNMCNKFYGISAGVGGYIDLWNKFWNMIKENCIKESCCSIMLQKMRCTTANRSRLWLTLSTNFQIALLLSGATSRALRHQNHYSIQQTKIHVETNLWPCAIIITSYNNCVLLIPEFHTDVECLPSSESHYHNAYVIAILRKATISFIMSVRPSVHI